MNNNEEEVEFLDAPVNENNNSNSNNPKTFDGFKDSYESKPVSEDSVPNKGPFTDIKPQGKFFTPHIEEEKKEEPAVNTNLGSNRTINFSQNDQPTSEYTSPTYNQNIGLMKRHFSQTEEKIDPKKTMPKSILYTIIFGVIAFFAGPKYIIPYTIKYIENPLINIFPNIDQGTINTLYVIKASLTLTMLSFFFGAFIYSVYNLFLQGRKLETYKDDVLKIFGVCFLVAISVAILNAVIKIEIVTPIMRVLTINGLLYKIKI